jgi:hypothetical protein
MSTTKTIDLESFKNGMQLHWNFSKQTSLGLKIRLYDDAHEYANAYAGSNDGSIVDLANDGAVMSGSDKSLKCDVIYDRNNVNLRYWKDGKPFFDPNHEGKQVAYVTIINGEDATDNDYNDFHITVVGWVHT